MHPTLPISSNIISRAQRRIYIPPAKMIAFIRELNPSTSCITTYEIEPRERDAIKACSTQVGLEKTTKLLRTKMEAPSLNLSLL